MTTRLRTVLLLAAGAAAMALVLTLVANPHALGPRACHVPAKHWRALSLEQQARLSTCNLHHARTAIAWVKAHHELYNTRSLASVAVKVVADHRKLERKAARTLRAIQDAIFLRESCFGYVCGSFATRERIVTEVVCSFRWNGTPCSGSYSVMRVTLCETGGTLLAEPGDDPGSTYKTLFEMGSSERAEYGVGLNGNDYHDIHAGVWAQVASAHNMFIRRGGTWGPWACRPDGSVAY